MSDSLDRDGFPQPQNDFGVSNPYASPGAEEIRGQDYITPTGEPLNPWLTMWMRPRETVRQQLDTDPERHVLLLAALAGAAGQTANNASALPTEFAYRLPVFVALLAIGAIFGLIWLYGASWLVGAVGRAIGGVATALQCRTALAWSSIPGLWVAPLYLLIGVYYVTVGPDAVVGAGAGQGPPNPNPFALMPPWMLAIIAIGMIIWVWQIVITCQAVGEAHQFSSLRGFGTLLLSLVALMAIVIGVSIAIFLIMALFFLGIGK